MIPEWAAHPQCTRLTVPPVRLASIRPDPIEAAMPIAFETVSLSAPCRRAAATADPMVPQMEVACRPLSKKTELRSSGS